MSGYRHLDPGTHPHSEECLPAEPDVFHEYDPQDGLEDWQR